LWRHAESSRLAIAATRSRPVRGRVGAILRRLRRAAVPGGLDHGVPARRGRRTVAADDRCERHGMAADVAVVLGRPFGAVWIAVHGGADRSGQRWVTGWRADRGAPVWRPDIAAVRAAA